MQHNKYCFDKYLCIENQEEEEEEEEETVRKVFNLI